jgi:hypothetical protein
MHFLVSFTRKIQSSDKEGSANKHFFTDFLNKTHQSIDRDSDAMQMIQRGGGI